MMMVETLWLRLRTSLSAFAQKLLVADPTLIQELQRTSNDAFLLRGYLAIRRRTDGDEIAITVDVQSDGQQITIVSDACTDAGSVVAPGPSAAIQLSEGEPSVEAALNDWLREFERFLVNSEPAVVAAASHLA
jgi:hypothetical protein